MSLFDRFAERVSRWVSTATFFAFCVLLVVVWLPSIVVIRDVDTWQLIINTATTIITFLMVAVLQNSTKRFEDSTNQKLDALTNGLADQMEWLSRWNHERLTGNAREVVAHQLSEAAKAVRNNAK